MWALCWRELGLRGSSSGLRRAAAARVGGHLGASAGTQKKDSETKERLKKARSTISTAVCRRPKSKSTPLERDGRLIERKKRVNEREDQRLMRRLRRRKREQLKSDFMVHSKVYCNIIKKSDSLFQLKRFEMSFKTYVDGVSLYYFSCSLVSGESFFGP